MIVLLPKPHIKISFIAITRISGTILRPSRLHNKNRCKRSLLDSSFYDTTICFIDSSIGWNPFAFFYDNDLYVKMDTVYRRMHHIGRFPFVKVCSVSITSAGEAPLTYKGFDYADVIEKECVVTYLNRKGKWIEAITPQSVAFLLRSDSDLLKSFEKQKFSESISRYYLIKMNERYSLSIQLTKN